MSSFIRHTNLDTVYETKGSLDQALSQFSSRKVAARDIWKHFPHLLSDNKLREIHLWFLKEKFNTKEEAYAKLMGRRTSSLGEKLNRRALQAEQICMYQLGEIQLTKRCSTKDRPLNCVKGACLFNRAHLVTQILKSKITPFCLFKWFSKANFLPGDSRKQFYTNFHKYNNLPVISLISKFAGITRVQQPPTRPEEKFFEIYNIPSSRQLKTIDLKNRQKLAQIRGGVERQIKEEGPFPSQKIVRELYEGIAKEMRAFTAMLIDQSIQILGKPPCKFAMIGFGSLAREDMTPYSDLEFGCLIEEKKDTLNNKAYFRKLTYLIHLRVVNLGETTPWHLGIEPLKSFVDRLTPKAFAFDGMGIKGKGYKTPLGNRGVKEVKENEQFELIQTPSKMASYQGKDKTDGKYWFDKAPYLPMELQNIVWIETKNSQEDRSLVKKYRQEMNRVLKQSLDERIKMPNNYKRTVQTYLATELLREIDMRSFGPDLGSSTKKGKIFNIEKDLYSLPHLFIERLALFYSIEAINTFDKIDQLHENKVLKKQAAKRLNTLVSQTMYGKLEMCSQGKGVNPLLKYFRTDDEKLIQKQFTLDNKGLKRIEEMYKTLVPLYAVMKAFLSGDDQPLRKTELYDESSLTLGEIASRLLQHKKAMKLYEKAIKESPKNSRALNALGRAHEARGDLTRAISFFNEALKIDIESFGEKNPKVAMDYNNLGRAYKAKRNLTNAIRFFNEALKIDIELFGKKSPNVAVDYNNLGRAYKAKGNLTNTISFFNEALKIDYNTTSFLRHKFVL